jgi:DNA-binding MarR family transcriptional regulator
MTTREFLNTVITSAINDEMTEKAQALLVALDKKNEQRKSKPSKVAVANEPIKASIVAFITANGQKVSSEIAESLNISTQKASALCRQMVESGLLNVTDVKVKGRGKQKGYSAA